MKDMINRKQRCVRDGALASLLENERCQDLQEYQQVLHGHNLEIVGECFAACEDTYVANAALEEAKRNFLKMNFNLK